MNSIKWGSEFDNPEGNPDVIAIEDGNSEKAHVYGHSYFGYPFDWCRWAAWYPEGNKGKIVKVLGDDGETVFWFKVESVVTVKNKPDYRDTVREFTEEKRPVMRDFSGFVPKDALEKPGLNFVTCGGAIKNGDKYEGVILSEYKTIVSTSFVKVTRPVHRVS